MKPHVPKARGLFNSSEDKVEETKSTQISYWNNSLKEILVYKENELSDIDELLTAIKFKVLFSSDQVRHNLKDYILKIYRSIVNQKNG